MPLTIEQQRALAIAQAKRKRAEAEAAPSLRSETDAIIEEAAAAIPGGFAAFDAKPADPQRMAAMGYVADPLAKSGYARPQAQQPRMADTGNTNSLLADVARGLEAPVRGLTGGGLEGWARTTQADPLLGATQAVDFISPVDDLGRAYQGAKQAGAGLIDGDMAKAGEGAQQLAIDGSFAALQMLPGSMAARGLNVPKNTLALNVADLERAAVQATRAPPVGKPAPQAAAPQPQPAPFSAPAEPKSSGFLRNNADRIVGGGVGAFAGSAGDAFAASGGDGNGGPDIINPYTGAAAGMFLPRAFARGYRAAGSAIRGGGFDEAVAVRRVRNLLAPAGRSADEIAAADTAQFGGAEGGKPSVLADLTQNAQNFSVNLSRQSGVAPELASQQSADLARTRTGRLFSDVETTTNITPATVTADLDAAIKQASEEISPAYEALFGKYAGVNSERLMQLADDPVVGKYVRAAIKEAESLQTTAGQAPSNARTWDLVKRALDRPIDKAFSGGSRPSEALLRAREAVVRELDELMPEYAAVREGADAPRMKGARKEGAKVAGGGLSVEKVRAIASKLTGKPLTALQMGAVEKIVLDIEKARGIDGLSSERMREVLGAVFGQDAADQLTARIRADQTILKNAQRRDPDLGSATSQAGMADRGLGEMAADAFRTVRNPLEAALAMMSRSGAYTQAQRNRIAEMLYGGATDENLARIYGNRPPRNALNVEPPPTPQGPPVNRLGMSGSPEALGAAGGTAIGMATAPDQNGDGVVDAQERMLGGAGGALTGGIAGRAMFRGGDRGAIGGGPQAQGFGGGSQNFGGKGKPSTFIANTKATKPMATEFPNVTITPAKETRIPMGYGQRGTVTTKDGKGLIEFSVTERGDIRVLTSEIPEAARGKGLGLEMYEALAQYASRNRKALYSDAIVSGDAVKIYMALKRRGYNVRLANPEGTVENPNYRPSTWDAEKNVLFPVGSTAETGAGSIPKEPNHGSAAFKVTKYGIPAVGGGSLIVIMEPDAEA
jgi:hypothetical protein